MKKSILYLPGLFFLLLISTTAEAQIREKVVFENDGQVIHGNVIMPDDNEQSPMVLYLGGVNEFGRFEDQRQEFIAEILENTFIDMGVGVMYFDPRGLGDTEGKWQRTTLEQFTGDTKAAIAYLRNRRDVDLSRIGMIAHGESGWMAFRLAEGEPEWLSFIITMGTPPFDSNRHLVNKYYNDYLCSGQDSASSMQKAERKAKSHLNWVSVLPLTKRWRHMKLFQDYDPGNSLKNIDIPVLLIYGENDGDVYPDWARDYLRETFNGDLPENFTVQSIGGANHDFKVADRCYEKERSAFDKNFSAAFKDSLRTYVVRQFFEDSFFSN